MSSSEDLLPHDIVHDPCYVPPTDKPRASADTVSDMTVVDDNYTGHVEPQTGARRTLPGASIVKVSVGQMDNNAYLVTCSQTGETLLIDAANDAEILLELIERFAPKLSLIVTSHQHPDHWLALDDGGQGHRRTDRRSPARCGAAARSSRTACWPTATPSRSASCRSTSSTSRATPPDPSRWRWTEPTTRPTCSPATACFPAASARRGKRATSSKLLGDVTSRVFNVYGDSTVVYPGHGDDTTLGAERPHLDEWKQRGW